MLLSGIKSEDIYNPQICLRLDQNAAGNVLFVNAW